MQIYYFGVVNSRGPKYHPVQKLCFMCVCVCLQICFESGELNGVEMAVFFLGVGRERVWVS